jgi:hypothetical protein
MTGKPFLSSAANSQALSEKASRPMRFRWTPYSVRNNSIAALDCGNRGSLMLLGVSKSGSPINS